MDLPDRNKFWDTWIDKNGYVWFRIDNQSYRLAFDPKEAEQLEEIKGYGKRHAEYLKRSLQIALGKMEFRYTKVTAVVQ